MKHKTIDSWKSSSKNIYLIKKERTKHTHSSNEHKTNPFRKRLEFDTFQPDEVSHILLFDCGVILFLNSICQIERNEKRNNFECKLYRSHCGIEVKRRKKPSIVYCPFCDFLKHQIEHCKYKQ